MSAASLRRAGELIRSRGKASGTYQDAEGRIDATGALRSVHFGSPFQIPRDGDHEYWLDFVAVCRAVGPREPYGVPPGNLIEWSDSCGSADDVAAMFERAAASID